MACAVYPQEELMPAAKKLAAAIADAAPIAVRASKKAINEGLQGDIDAGIALEAKLFGSCEGTKDQKNAMAAFLEKRPHDPFENC